MLPRSDDATAAGFLDHARGAAALLEVPTQQRLEPCACAFLSRSANPARVLALVWTDENDVYALLIFEQSAAATRPIDNVDSPRWHVDCPRAFKFPITAPFSALHVALFDSDAQSFFNLIDNSRLTHATRNTLRTACQATCHAHC